MMRILDILDRVSKAINSSKNKDIAAALKVSENTCSGWKNRNTIPYEALFKFAEDYKLSIDWLFTGESKDGRNGHKFTRAELDPKPLDIPYLIDLIESIKDKDDLKYYLKSMISGLDRGKFDIAAIFAKKMANEIEKEEEKHERK